MIGLGVLFGLHTKFDKRYVQFQAEILSQISCQTQQSRILLPRIPEQFLQPHFSISISPEA